MVSFLAAILCMPTFVAPTSSDEVWPGFLGQGATTVDEATIASDWSPDDNIAWQAKLPGYGQSSPVIWKSKVYVTSVVGPMKDECVVTCLNLEDGSEIWQKGVESSDKVESNLYVSRAAPTPVVDDAGVTAFFESGNIVAYDHEGNERWSRSFAEENGKYTGRFGLGASLTQTDEAIYVLADHEGPSYLTALSKEDGSTIWKRERTSRVSWSSPTLVEVDGQQFILVSSEGSIDGYEATSGDRVFSYTDVAGNTVTTPIGYDNGIFLVGAAPGQRGENQAAAEKSNMAMQIVVNNGEPSLTKLWQAERTTSSFGSPIIYQGNAYWVNRSGAVNCFNVENGELLFQGRLAEAIWATPIGLGNRIYFFGQKGETTILAAGDEYNVLGEYRLWEEEEREEGGQGRGGNFGGRTQYGAAMVNGSLLVRTGDILYCVREE